MMLMKPLLDSVKDCFKSPHPPTPSPTRAGRGVMPVARMEVPPALVGERFRVGGSVLKHFLGVAVAVLLLTACGGTTVVNPTAAPPTIGPLPTLQDVAFRPATVPMSLQNGGKAALLGVLNVHTYTVNRFDWSPDGKFLLSIDGSGQSLIWSLADGIRQYELRASEGLSQAWYSADSKMIVGVGADRSLYFFDTENGSQLTNLPTALESVTASAISPDRRLIAVGGGVGTVQIWNVDSRSITYKLQAAPVTAPTSTPERAGAPPAATPLLIGGASRMIVSSLAFSTDSGTVAAGMSDGAIHTWNANSGASGTTITDIRAPISQVAFAGSVMAASAGSELHIYESPSLQKRYGLTEPESAVGRAMTLAADGVYAAGIGSGDAAYVWRLQTANVTSIAIPDQQGRGTALAFSADSSFLVTTRSGDKGGAILWDVASFPNAAQGVRGRPINEFGNGIFAVSWSPDGKWLALADASGGITLWGVAE